MTAVDVDTRSDVYSLGVLLYELLTGTTPFDSKELLDAGFEALCRTTREVEPAFPSTRLRKLSLEKKTTIARLRRAQQVELERTVRGELDWIVMKAIDKKGASLRVRRCFEAGRSAFFGPRTGHCSRAYRDLPSQQVTPSEQAGALGGVSIRSATHAGHIRFDLAGNSCHATVFASGRCGAVLADE